MSVKSRVVVCIVAGRAVVFLALVAWIGRGEGRKMGRAMSCCNCKGGTKAHAGVVPVARRIAHPKLYVGGR